MTDEYSQFSALMKRKAYAEAAALAERQSVAANNRNGFWLSWLSTAHREAGNLDKALEAAQNACSVGPNNAWALLARAEVLQKKGEYAEARLDYEAALSDARAAGPARRGMFACLAHLKEYDRLLALVSQSGLSEQDARPWRIKGLVGLGRLEEASKECGAWLAERPDDPRALWQMTEVQIALEGLDPVLARMARMARIPGKPAVYGEIYAALCKRAGRNDEAAAQYETLSQRDTSPAILRKQAFALAKTGQEARAVPLMEELLRMDPSDPYLHAAYLPACRRLGDLERAWKFYHDLLALHPEEKGLYGRMKKVRKLLETAPETGEER